MIRKQTNIKTMKKLAGIIFFLSVILILPSCSSKEVTKENNTPKKDSTYVFDQVPTETVKQIEAPPVETPVITGPEYIVQLGAFSTMDKAADFTAMAKKKLSKEMVIVYNQEKKLYIVQINPPFTSKQEAEKLRDNIKQNKEFSDVWILTVNK